LPQGPPSRKPRPRRYRQKRPDRVPHGRRGLEFGHFVAIMIEWVMADFLRRASDYSRQRRLSGMKRAMRR
jgi:hypothetical protein